MKTNEILDALASADMKEKDVETWLNSRQSTSSVIETIFPVVYKKGNEFEILPHLDLSRKAEVWGYELLPSIVLAKKCVADGNVERTAWNNCKAFAEKCKLNGKKGSLPSKEVLKENWSKELVDKIRAMDKFLVENGVDAETRSTGDIRFAGLVWCSEVYDYNFAYYFDLRYGNDFFHQKNDTIFSDRLAVAF